MKSVLLVRCAFLLPFAMPLAVCSNLSAGQVEIAGAKVSLVDYQGPAILTVEATAKRTLRIDVTPQGETNPLSIGVDLPPASQTTWAADVEVVDENSRALPVRRSGLEWHKLTIPVPAERAAYIVRTVEPSESRPRVLPEKDREAAEPTTGMRASIRKWHDGRKAALSIRFDDSHPTHLSKAIPILREYGFRGTFMVCPGGQDPTGRHRSNFEEHQSEWEAVARRGDQELANHTAHHRGATGDDEMDREIGEASRTIWSLFPGKSKLTALNLGGGTKWETTRTLRYYLDKYHLFDASYGSLGMDDVYGNRPAAFQQHLDRHLAREGWCRIHFHAIGPDRNSTEATLRAALDTAKQHQAELWIAGMADIHKYLVERQSATLSLEAETSRRVLLKLRCSTDPQLYDHPLTIDVTLPPDWLKDQVTVRQVGADAAIQPIPSPTSGNTIRFHSRPASSVYVLER